MRVGLVSAFVSLAVVSMAQTPDVRAVVRKQISIGPQPLELALQELAKSSEIQLIYKTQIVGQKASPGAAGALTILEALTQVLSGTGLTFSPVDDHTITIVPASGQPVQSHETAPSESRRTEQGSRGIEAIPKRSFWDRFRISQADSAQVASGNSARSVGSGGNDEAVEEIIVTAQKRIERLQDVPVPVTTIRGEDLASSNLQRVQDYYSRIPGVNLTTGTWGEPRISIRGIATDPFDNPTVGITVDDLPYGSTASLAGNGGVPDIDPGELSRLEVLRGPQGTLYGAGGMGGLLKFVTVDPSTDAFRGRVQAGVNGVQHGSDVGFNVHGAVNVPFSDVWAVRASAFTREDPGYTDNIATGRKDVNSAEAKGGRLAALWRPSEDFSLKLSALAQNTTRDGSDDVDAGLGDYEQTNLISTGQYDRDTQSYGATILARLGRFDVTSVSGYSIDSFNGVSEYFGFAYENDVRTRKFSQEVRFSTALGERVDWLLGGFYTDEDNKSAQILSTVDPVTGALLQNALVGHFPNTFEEYALFTDFTFKLSDRFDVQVGGRQSRMNQTYHQTLTGPLVGGGTLDDGKRRTKASPFTYLLTPRFKFSDHLMLYARFASGYRPGGPNSNANLLNGVRPEYDPDKTNNYEIGIKGNALDRALTFDASVFYIDWKDIQLKFLQNGFSFKGNGSRARSQGIELSVEARPLEGLTIASWVAYTDAELTDDLPAQSVAAGVFGLSGDRLPFSSRFSGNLSVDERFSLGANVTGFVGATLSYVGSRKGIFAGPPPGGVRGHYPSYTQTDLRAGADFDAWTFNLFVNNLTDRRGVLLDDPLTPTSLVYIRPRAYGMSIARTF